jgi:hypothetical protein
LQHKPVSAVVPRSKQSFLEETELRELGDSEDRTEDWLERLEDVGQLSIVGLPLTKHAAKQLGSVLSRHCSWHWANLGSASI